MLETGQTISHYRILQKIGVGGMGEVYLADDMTLDRKVALKFLPEAFTSDPERMARFEREAKLLASLNHPNIAAIYGLEQADGKRFLIMEYVEGETLQARIGKGALPVEDALCVCRQIAEGLEAAHEKGVIHRDLKPANVMITGEEKVKILDFGLAKAFASEQSDLNLSNSPTLSLAATQPGIILGTAGYMSPEQARAKSVDRRADIWAFGVILYEMLTGSQLFTGETVSDTMASVLTQEPDLDKVPIKVRPLLKKCLAKDPKLRLRDIGDAMALLGATSEPELKSQPRKASIAAWIYAFVVTITIIILFVSAYLNSHNNISPQLARYHIAVPSMTSDHSISISPNGRWIAFVATSQETVDSLYLRDIESLGPRRIDETRGARYPFWSPDSQSVGFVQRGKLKKLDISSGSIQDICKAPYTLFGAGSWNSDGVIIFYDVAGGLYRVSEEGGESTAITSLDKSRNETLHFLPCFLPDDRHYLFVNWLDDGTKDIYIGSLGSENREKLVSEATMPIYVDVEPGYLLFLRENALYAQPFDADRLKLSGDSRRIAENLLIDPWTGCSTYSVSQNGLLIYRSAADQAGNQFVLYDKNGYQLRNIGKPGLYLPAIRFSPDEKQLAATFFDPVTSSLGIGTIECERNVDPINICSDIPCILPAWSPDGSKIAFSSSREGNYDIFARDVSGAGEENILINTSESEYLKDWSRNGQYIAYGATNGLYAKPTTGEKKPVLIIKSHSNLNTPAFSPDEKWIAFMSDDSGTPQVYILPFPFERQQKQHISTDGGVQPRWGRDGKEIYYLDLDGKMMSVEVVLDDEIKIGRPHELFDTGLNINPEDYQYDVTSDGSKFVLLKPVVQEKQTLIPIVANWTSLLEK